MRRIVVFAMVALLAIATIEARQRQDPDRQSNAGNVTILGAKGYEYEVSQADGVEPNTHTDPRNINISAEDWDSIRDSVLLKVQGKKANSGGGANSQGFAVVACDRASFDDVAHISLMRTANPREVVTSTNDSAASQVTGNIARTAPRFMAENKSETLYAVLSSPFLNGVIDAGWQIGSGGYRTLSVTVLDSFNGGGAAPTISFSIGCGQTLFPF
jgi:hypothetical protein